MSALISVLHYDIIFLIYGTSEQSVLTYSVIKIAKSSIFFGVDGICRFVFLIFVHKMFKWEIKNKRHGLTKTPNTK